MEGRDAGQRGRPGPESPRDRQGDERSRLVEDAHALDGAFREALDDVPPPQLAPVADEAPALGGDRDGRQLEEDTAPVD